MMASFRWKFASHIWTLLLVCIAYETTAYLLNGRGCGKVEQKAIPYQPRIVGGIDAKRERHPWLVNLQAYFVANKTRSTAIPCSGTLITRRFVLTAARCVLRSLDQGKGVLASIVEVYYSETERRKGNFRRARDIIIHPGFNPLTRLHNVALLRLFKTINRTKLARPICLMEKRENLVYKNASVLGWGWIMQNIVLRYATVKIVPFWRCKQKLNVIKQRKALTSKTLMCTAGVKRGPCKGDGGGPVEIWKGNKAYQVGIISFPKSCDASRDIPSAHERVDYYFEWIKTVIAYYHKWTWHPPDPAPAKPHDH
ncbi:serine protease 28 [Rhipicephalus microplus]|uniref:serine protease 28 n=1 Tax=Rhipicephalus microplus TaxID=6941 RepID=UPI003F6A9820